MRQRVNKCIVLHYSTPPDRQNHIDIEKSIVAMTSQERHTVCGGDDMGNVVTT